MDNAQLLHSVTGLAKTVGGSINLKDVNFEGLIPRADVIEMLNLVTSNNQVLSKIGSRTVTKEKGIVSIFDLDEPVIEFVDEEDPTVVSTQPATRQVAYDTQKVRLDINLTWEELTEAQGAGDGNFEQTVVNAFTTQMGNNVANAVFNGDTSLNALTRANKALRGIDGIIKKANAGANVFDANGARFGRGVFAAIRDAVPDRYQENQDGMQWFYNNHIGNAYQNELTTLGTNLSDQAQSQRNVAPPLGIEPIIAPQIASRGGATPIAPTSVANNTTYLQFVLTTLVTAGNPATAAAGVGRRFKVTCSLTGKSEICTGFLDTTLRINTSGLLGQTGTPSTTAADYTVTQADQTSILYGRPKMITVVYKNEVRTYRQWNQHRDRLEITMYASLDVLFPVPESFVMFKNIAAPPITWPVA